MNKVTINPEHTTQEKVYKRAFDWHQKITIGHHPSTTKDKWDAFDKFHKEFDKLNAIPLFIECDDCPNNHECGDCISLYWK